MNRIFRHRLAAPAPDAAPARRRVRGQSLVEFGLVFPIFVTMLMGLIEFAFVFNALLSVNYAARDASLAAAEAGDLGGADCVILQAVDAAIGAPTSDNRIAKVEIFEAFANGGPVPGRITVYTRNESAGNTSICLGIDGSTMSYDPGANGYAETDRCNVLGGCDPLVVNDTVDNVGVRIFYEHEWVTPITNFIGGGAGGLDFDRSSVMRMEPIL